MAPINGAQHRGPAPGEGGAADDRRHDRRQHDVEAVSPGSMLPSLIRSRIPIKPAPWDDHEAPDLDPGHGDTGLGRSQDVATSGRGMEAEAGVL